MNISRTVLTAALCLSVSVPAFAGDNRPTTASKILISQVDAAPFQLKQARTMKLSDTVSTSTYLGQTTLVTTPCSADKPTTLKVNVELNTITTLNQCGEGFTDGTIILRDPVTGQALRGDVAAVNSDSGDLLGLVQGQVVDKKGAPVRPGISLRATFHAVFVKDSAGNYTLVNVDTHGITTLTPSNSGAK